MSLKAAHVRDRVPEPALFFGTREQIEQLRPMSAPINRFQFGAQVVTTGVFMMAPRGVASRQPRMDVTAAMDEEPRERAVMLKMLPADSQPRPTPAGAAMDPFADIVVCGKTYEQRQPSSGRGQCRRSPCIDRRPYQHTGSRGSDRHDTVEHLQAGRGG